MNARDSVRRDVWKGRRVLVTGHTGFKGGWLAFWLHRLGAEVSGFALEPTTEPSFFEAMGLGQLVAGEFADVRDAAAIQRVVAERRPELVFHLAAQPIVLESYRDPAATFATNVMGTVHLLDALRATRTTRACIVVTSDKCYENREWAWGYRECDPLGGRDAYSASKACQELVTSAYRSAFFPPDRVNEHGLVLAAARAGNVIGGGDWGAHRIVPDLVRAFARGEPGVVRNPRSVRPWQHVMDPLRGYLLLAQACLTGAPHASAYNFGPLEIDTAEVARLADGLAASWGGDSSWRDASDPNAPHEAATLRLDTSLARHELGYRPRLDFKACMRATVDWYRAFYAGASVDELRQLTEHQLSQHGAER